MFRFDLQTACVMIMATASALCAAYWMSHIDGQGVANAQVPAAVMTGSSDPVAKAAQVLKDADGHYWADASVDGRAVRVLVDTGASVVALTRDDAQRLGVLLDPADFSRTVQTASGPVGAAPVTLKSVSVSGVEVRDVEALVVEAGLEQSLLGMSYLGRLSSFEASPDGLTLRP